MTTNKIQNTFSIPKPVFPILGGFTVGLIALLYPEILYWGFENVDTLLETRPFVKGLSVDLLLQLIAVKIVATSFCRACGLVGGYYAPSLFIGAATGMAYGKIFGSFIPQFNSIFHISGMEVASPQAYGLVIYIAFITLQKDNNNDDNNNINREIFVGWDGCYTCRGVSSATYFSFTFI